MLILFIDSSAHLAKVFLIENGKCLARATDDGEKTHASNLPLCVENVLETAGKELAGVDVISVTNGPGSYTGLRIGIAYAKALAYGAKKPLVCVNTLDYIARSCPVKDAGVIVSLLDARNTLCFYSTYVRAFDENGSRFVPFRTVGSDYIDFICGLLSRDAGAGNKVVFTGDGAVKNREKIENAVKGAVIPDLESATGTAEAAYAIVCEKLDAAGADALLSGEFSPEKAAAEYYKPVHITLKKGDA